MISTTTEQSNQEQILETTEFTLKTIENLGKRVRVTDSDEETGLQLYCSVNYEKSGNETDADAEIIRKCRGVVFHGPDIIMKAFPYTPEFSVNEEEELKQNIGPILENVVIFEAHEGALIRVFYYMDRWYISTHRKLDAFKSKWSSKKSFGTLFREALTQEVSDNEELRNNLPDIETGTIERFQETLDKDKQYMFLVRNNEENRIVCSPPEKPTLYHVGTFVEGELYTDISCGVKMPVKHTFKNLEEICEATRNIDYRNTQGFILFAPGNKQFKIVNDRYREAFDIRGNESSIKFRYLQLRMDYEKATKLGQIYPQMIDTFLLYEDLIYNIGLYIYDCYVKRYIKKEWVQLPQQEFIVMKECHTIYLADKSNNKISMDIVMNVLNSQNATDLNRMIRRELEERRKRQAEDKLNLSCPPPPDGPPPEGPPPTSSVEQE